MMNYNEYLELPYKELYLIKPEDICERCRTGKRPVQRQNYTERYSGETAIMYWHYDYFGWMGCDAWRIRAVQDGHEQELREFDRQFPK